MNTFNFNGSLIELKKIIEDVINEYGENVKCKLNTVGSFPNKWNSEIILIQE